MSLWKRFFECSCGGEGIMMSYEMEEEGMPYVDLAFFSCGYISKRQLSLWDKLRYCWHILITGEPFADEVMLNSEIAEKLGRELLRFSKYPYKLGDKRNNKNGKIGS